MLLERTISQLDIGHLPPEKAAELGHLGYMQWLAGLPGAADYRRAAMEAFSKAQPFARISPAVAVFCDLLVASTRMPPRPLAMVLPLRQRRGGATARRSGRMIQ
ncbi:hypothetical protein P6F26_14525 [Roseibacterium sp. SDUM158017]|uniref:hypothetical protein n=1 Tax=Roseicyclus salinarum TaxID=3036773 RepID=UPI002414E231|nr:hypothetical protein [Roseibacterium sp. SDUM158017]MDG4649657.1 hypothetical protein [Roseibacterium sp. SDUM158017]